MRRGAIVPMVVALVAMIAFAHPPVANAEAAGATNSASAAGPNAAVATVGSHRITQREMDAEVLGEVVKRIPADQLYDLRKEAVDKLVDQYVIDQAAKKAHMSPDDYVKHQLETNTPPKITEKDAQQYYDAHKSETSKSFASIKPALIAALQRRQDSQRRDQMIAKLRAEYPIGVMLTPPRSKVASAGHPSEGPADAPITIVEFADFQCPFCRGALDSIRAVKAKYGDKVRWVYMDFPLSMHAHAMDAANAARCADAQHKFWPFHDALFADQSKLKPEDLKATAKRLGLDTKSFDKCLDDATYQAGIRKDMAEGDKLGVTGTPTFFINGRELEGARPPQAFDEIINDELANTAKPQRRASAK